ncbi:MAG TPA: undecaprenyl-diphosphate phosphatase [Phycisphaerales bacterium]|nr:undecaprenyl-diphosphate phosphatase [Phycisphaerales bacterium]|tara:strand:+ start:10352 stop:11170 length:819 start_codon:yes stop_codon:yes gene_type:complete
MTWWQAMILGIVEGLTEYLPVSSTGHLIIVSQLMGLNDTPEMAQATYAFNIVIQVGAIAAVLGLYRMRVLQMCKGLAGKDTAGKKLAINLILAFLPAAVLGPLLDDRIEATLNGYMPVIGALFVGGVVMVLLGKKLRKDDDKRFGIDDITWQIALLIGIGQCVAMWPGTSRSMMTIVTAVLLGMRLKDAAEFSFLLGLITLGAATGYKLLKEYQVIMDNIGAAQLLIGLFFATVSAALAVKWFVAFLTKRGLTPFGYYRIALAVVILVLVWG